MNQTHQSRDLSLRMAFPYDKAAEFYEPTNIHLAPEYFFLEYTFSTLVEFDESGELIPAVAQEFKWVGNDLHLHIREDLKTVSGVKITIDDVIFSLKRLLVRTGNTHGDFSSLVCGNTPITSISDECPGITKNNTTLILKAGKRKAFLLPMLAALDFAIIPQASVEQKTLKIINYKETSGPYYVAEDSETGRIVLKANRNHFHYSEKMPQTVYLVPTDPKDPKASLEALECGEGFVV